MASKISNEMLIWIDMVYIPRNKKCTYIFFKSHTYIYIYNMNISSQKIMDGNHGFISDAGCRQHIKARRHNWGAVVEVVGGFDLAENAGTLR